MVKKSKSKLLACKVEMTYINRIKVSSVSTGLSTFLPFYEDRRNDERITVDTDLEKSDSRKRHKREEAKCSP